MPKDLREYNYVFTFQIGTKDEITEDEAILIALDIYENLQDIHYVRYFVFQLECGDVKQRYHLQGYIQFNVKVSKKLINDKFFYNICGYLHEANGSSEEASVYCIKSKSAVLNLEPFEWGTKKAHGRRIDLEDLFDAIRNNTINLKQIYEDNKLLQYYHNYKKSMDTLFLIYTPKIRPMPKCYVYWGEGGKGKSHKAHIAAMNITNQKEHEIYYHSGSKWLTDDYIGQKVMIINEFDPLEINQFLFNNLVDKFCLPQQVKGSFLKHCAEYIFITCNTHPKDWYNLNENQEQALRRRILSIKHVKKDNPFLPKCAKSWDDFDSDEDTENLLKEHILPVSGLEGNNGASRPKDILNNIRKDFDPSNPEYPLSYEEATLVFKYNSENYKENKWK